MLPPHADHAAARQGNSAIVDRRQHRQRIYLWRIHMCSCTVRISTVNSRCTVLIADSDVAVTYTAAFRFRSGVAAKGSSTLKGARVQRDLATLRGKHSTQTLKGCDDRTSAKSHLASTCLIIILPLLTPIISPPAQADNIFRGSAHTQAIPPHPTSQPSIAGS